MSLPRRGAYVPTIRQNAAVYNEDARTTPNRRAFSPVSLAQSQDSEAGDFARLRKNLALDRRHSGTAQSTSTATRSQSSRR